MKSLARNLSALTFLITSGHGAAEVIYSGLQDLTIPANYAGTYIDVDGMTSSASESTGWDFNPFMGGVYLYNSAAFQPARDGTGGMDTVLKFDAGSTISASGLNFASGSGGSMDHLGTQFTAGGGGVDGYLGFKLNGNYGWMRVVFTNNAANAKVLDWAYDTSGSSAAIATGNILQSAVVDSAQTVTLNSAAGSFTLGTEITDSGVNGINVNSVVKTGTGTTTLTGANTYTGTTTVQAGTLKLGSSGIANSTTLIVGNAGSSGAVLDVSAISGGITVGAGQTLKGIGTVNGDVTINGTHAPGNSAGLQTVTGDLSYGSASIFDWELTSNTATQGTSPNYTFDQVDMTGAADTLSIATGAKINLILNNGVAFSNGFWNTDQSWNIFTNASTVTGTFLINSISNDMNSTAYTALHPNGHFAMSGATLTWTAVPELSNVLAGLLLGAGLLRRRR
jgi:autotransporter-associated beta strand protein